jgi:hypothetical protein
MARFRLPGATSIIVMTVLAVVLAVLPLVFPLPLADEFRWPGIAVVAVVLVLSCSSAFRSSAKQDADIVEIREQLAQVHEPFRLDVKARALVMAREIGDMVGDLEHFAAVTAGKPGADPAANEQNMRWRYRKEQERILRLFADFEFFGLQDPDTRVLSARSDLQGDDIQKVIDSLSTSIVSDCELSIK